MFQGLVTSATALFASAFSSAQAATTGVLTGLVGRAFANTTESLISENPIGLPETSGASGLKTDYYARADRVPTSGSPRPSGPRDDVFDIDTGVGARPPRPYQTTIAPAFGLPLFTPLSVVLWSHAITRAWRGLTRFPSEKIRDLRNSIAEDDLTKQVPHPNLRALSSFLRHKDPEVRIQAASAVMELPWGKDANPELLSFDEWSRVADNLHSGLAWQRTGDIDGGRILPTDYLIALLVLLFERNHPDAKTILRSILNYTVPMHPTPLFIFLLGDLAERQKAQRSTGRGLLRERMERGTLFLSLFPSEDIVQRLYAEILETVFFGPDTSDAPTLITHPIASWREKFFVGDGDGGGKRLYENLSLLWHAFHYLVLRKGDTPEEKLTLLAALNEWDDTDLNNFLWKHRGSTKHVGKNPLIELVKLARDWMISTGDPLPKEAADSLVRLISASRDVRRVFDPLLNQPGDVLLWDTVKDSWKVLENILTRDDLAYRGFDRATEEMALLNTALSVARRATITATDGEDADEAMAASLEIRRILAVKVVNFFMRRGGTLSPEHIAAVWVPAVIFLANYAPDYLHWLHESRFIEMAGVRHIDTDGGEKASDPSLMRAITILAQYEDRPEFFGLGHPKLAQALLADFDLTYDPSVWVKDSFKGAALEDRVHVDFGSGFSPIAATSGASVVSAVPPESDEAIDMGGEHVVVRDEPDDGAES